jgi:hypothetical protein
MREVGGTIEGHLHSRPLPVCYEVTSNRRLGVQLLWPFSDIREGLLLWRITGSKGALSTEQSSIWWSVSFPSVERPLCIGRYDGCGSCHHQSFSDYAASPGDGLHTYVDDDAYSRP